MTTNEMIMATIKTKLTKQPKYKSILEDLGYIVYDSTWSYYNNWSVKNPETGRTVLLSKGYDNKKRLYDLCSSITHKAKNINKVDLVGYLKKPRIERTEESKYKKAMRELLAEKRHIKWADDDIQTIQSKIEKLQKELQYHEGRKEESEKKIEEIRKRIKSWKN